MNAKGLRQRDTGQRGLDKAGMEDKPRSFSSFLPHPVLCIWSEMLVTMRAGCMCTAEGSNPKC